MTFKLIGLSPRGYWISWRNRIDLFITSSGLLWSILFVCLLWVWVYLTILVSILLLFFHNFFLILENSLLLMQIESSPINTRWHWWKTIVGMDCNCAAFDDIGPEARKEMRIFDFSSYFFLHFSIFKKIYSCFALFQRHPYPYQVESSRVKLVESSRVKLVE